MLEIAHFIARLARSRVFRLIIFLALIIVLILTLFVGQTKQHRQRTGLTGTPRPTPISGSTFYVSKKGNNSDGRSWETAWNEFDHINWAVVQPSDTILLDGGSQQMVYSTTMYINKSGMPNHPITMKRAIQPGRNGKVILFGGRSIPLPYCGQRNYTYQTAGVLVFGIRLNENAWIVIDGMSWGGMVIYGTNGAGIELDNNPTKVTFRNIEVYDNGSAVQQGDGTWTVGTGSGVFLTGANLSFENMNIYNNSDDSFQGGANAITIRHTWDHITREDPTQPGLPFNQCIHQDGLQYWASGIFSGILIEDSIFGPGLAEGVILGQPGNGTTYKPTIVNNVTIRNTLFTNKIINIEGFPKLKESNWLLDHVTVIGPFPAVGVWLEGSGHVITNSIFYGGHILLPDGLAHSFGNCQWKTDGDTKAIEGKTTDPQLVSNVSALTAA